MNSSFRKACASLWLSGLIVCLTNRNYNKQAHDTKHRNFGKSKRNGWTACMLVPLTVRLVDCRQLCCASVGKGKSGSSLGYFSLVFLLYSEQCCWFHLSKCLLTNAVPQCFFFKLSLWSPALIRRRIMWEHIELLKRMFYFLLIQTFICTLTFYMVCSVPNLYACNTNSTLLERLSW